MEVRKERKDQKCGLFGAEVTKAMSSVLRMKGGEVGGGDDLRKQEPEGVRPLGQQGEKKKKVIRGQ